MKSLILISFLVAGVTIAHADESTSMLKNDFRAALDHSAQLQVAGDREKLAQLQVSLARTGYLPQVNLEALTTDGFPGSTGALGVTGLMGSPFRKGTAYGLVVTETLLDFGKTSRSVESAQQAVGVEQGRTQIEKSQVLQAVLETFLDCAYSQSEKANWDSINALSAVIQKEVGKYVATGQRSIVDKLLVQEQTDEALRKSTRYDLETAAIKKRMSILTGLDAGQIQCSRMETFNLDQIGTRPVDKGLYVDQAQQEMQQAQAQLHEARAGYLPKLVAMGSIGEMDDARLVEKKDYSVGLGLVIPIFDGNLTNVQVERAKALVDEKSHKVTATEQWVDLTNAQFDETIGSLNTEVTLLKTEVERAQKAYDKARERYFALKGNLVDLRESIRNLAKIQNDYNTGEVQLLRASIAKKIFNGNLQE